MPHKSVFSATCLLFISLLCIFISGTIFLRWLLIIFSNVNYFNLSLVKFLQVLRTNFFHSYCKLFLTRTTNYFLLLVLRIIFSVALGIIFHGIVNLFFGLQFLAGLRLRGTGSSTFPLKFLRNSRHLCGFHLLAQCCEYLGMDQSVQRQIREIANNAITEISRISQLVNSTHTAH